MEALPGPQKQQTRGGVLGPEGLHSHEGDRQRLDQHLAARGGPHREDLFAAMALHRIAVLVAGLPRRRQGHRHPVDELTGVLPSLLRGGGVAGVEQGGDGEVERGLTAPGGRGELDSPAAGRLLAELDAHVFRAGLGGEDLRRILRRSGAGYEAGLVREGVDRLGPGRVRVLGRQLAQNLLEGLASSPEPPAGEPPERGIAILREALREAVLDALRGGGDEEGKSPPRARPLPARAPGGFEELARDLPEILRKGIARLPEGALRQRATARLPRVIGRLGGLELRCLVVRILGEPLEEGTAGARARGAAAEGIEPDPAPLDLKGKLLAALRELPEGRLRSALIRAAGGIEAEQLLNLARQESSEPLHWSLPVAEGSRLSSAHLFHQRTWEDAEGSRAPGAPLHRLTLAVDLTGTGAVRADLVLRAGSLSVRVLAAEEEVAERLRQEIPALVQALAAGGRRVGVRVDAGSLEEVEVGERALDIQLLREQHLMDVEG